MARFPLEIRHFAALFVDLQYDRTIADYVPYENFLKSEVEILADTAEEIIFRFMVFRQAYCAPSRCTCFSIQGRTEAALPEDGGWSVH